MKTQEDLPKGWQWVRCQDVIDVRDGTHSTPKYIPQGIPLVTSKNLKNGTIDFNDICYISKRDHEEIQRRSKVEDGDIIMAMIGTIGNPVIVKKRFEFSIKNIALFKFSKSLVLNQYFYYLLHSSLLEKQLSKESLGVTQKFVSLQVLRDLKIPLPPIAEQKRIAAIAQKCDRLRRTRRYTQQLSNSYLRSVFLEMFGDPVTNPMGWDKEQLGDLCRIRRGASPRPIDDFLGGTVPWIKIGDGAKGDSLYLSSTKDFVTKEGAKKSVYLEPGSLIFANCGVSLGFARILTISGCIHDGWLSFDQLSKNNSPDNFRGRS